MSGGAHTVGRRLVVALLFVAVALPCDAQADRRGRALSPLDSTRATARSQSGPPLTAGAAAGDEASAGAEARIGEGDPLVGNGLGSPVCRGAFGPGGLSSTARADCETSGFAAAAAPTGNFGIDVHIDTGVLGLSSGGLLTTVQDLCVTPLWMALVWAIHALVVMLEWCFAIDLLDSPSVELGIARGLRAMQAAFTLPWLATTLSIGAVALAYDGLVHRRVGESLGRALLALAMTAGGLCVMLDPAGTVGSVGRWANDASVGTLAVTARGSATPEEGALDGELRMMFAAVVEGPWCYLEFGDVAWCRDPSRLDPRLRSAALALAAEESSRVGCTGAGGSSGECAAPATSEGRALAHSATLLRTARTNGAIFLALPANGPERNSINDERSLLRAICQTDDATRCRGPSAEEAEFRTNRGTWPRVGGLLLILAGAVGVLLLLGHLALRLLLAALFSLLYLLLTPLIALAPALGERGRAAFRRWSGQLLAALVSKLLFAFVLGVVLAVLGILAGLGTLGWWTQWLLMSAFWWGAFVHRHRVLQLAGLGDERSHARYSPLVRPSRVTRDMRRVVSQRLRGRRGRHERQSVYERAGNTLGEIQRRLSATAAKASAQVGAARQAASEPVDAQAQRLVESEWQDARDDSAPDAITERAAKIEARLARLRREHDVAVAGGDNRRAVGLALRARRIEREAHAVRSIRGSPSEPARGEQDDAYDARERDRARFLDAQAMLPGALAARRAGSTEQRDYAALAGLAGRAPREYERLVAGEQRAARVAIDRELALRRERLLVTTPSVGRAATTGRPESDPPGFATPWRAPQSSRPERAPTSESPVMEDARAVAERRKRQLGYGRP